LTSNGQLDTGFGNVGRTFSSFSPGAQSYDDSTAGVVVTPLGVVIAGNGSETVSGPDSDTRFGIARIVYDHVFANGFE
jgi:hypothetical protein